MLFFNGNMSKTHELVVVKTEDLPTILLAHFKVFWILTDLFLLPIE